MVGGVRWYGGPGGRTVCVCVCVCVLQTRPILEVTQGSLPKNGILKIRWTRMAWSAAFSNVKSSNKIVCRRCSCRAARIANLCPSPPSP